MSIPSRSKGAPLRDWVDQLPPVQRAAFCMFLIAEVHPFDDGNGRLARVMMNAELIAGDEHPVIIAIGFRGDYIAGLRRLSYRGDPRQFLRMLDHAQEFVSRLQFSDLDELLKALEASNAFAEGDSKRLKMPPRVV